MILPDKTAVVPGTIIGELHCNNRSILGLVRQRGNPFAACREDLKSLRNWILHDRLGRQIEAFYACTILTRAAYTPRLHCSGEAPYLAPGTGEVFL